MLTGGSSPGTIFSLGGTAKTGGSFTAAAKSSTAVVSVVSFDAVTSRLSMVGAAGATGALSLVFANAAI